MPILKPLLGAVGITTVGTIAASAFASSLSPNIGGLTNEEIRNRRFESQNANILGGIGSAAAGATIGGLAGRIAKNRVGGLAGGLIGASLGFVVGSSTSDISTERAILTNDYMSNAYGSDVVGARPSYRNVDPVKAVMMGAIGGASVFGAGLGLRAIAGNNALSSSARKAGRMMSSTTGASLAGLGIGATLAISQMNTRQDRNRIQGLGY
jgi:hypothetical protein